MKIGINWHVLIPFAAFMAFATSQAHAQQANASVVSSCGSASYVAGRAYPQTQDTTGKLCTGATVTPSGTQHVDGTGTAGTPAGGVLSVQGVSGGTNLPAVTTPGQRTIVTLDVKTVTSGGTAVTAISAGHRTAGGFLQNPVGATVSLCINEIGTASGTTSSGDTTCIAPGGSYNVAPAAAAVSVITSDSSHPFSGYGMN